MTTKNGGRQAPPTIEELWNLRNDYQDVELPELGGTTLRLYALTGNARAELMSEMVDLSHLEGADQPDLDTATVRRVFDFQTRVVGASLGYPSGQWGTVGDVLGNSVIDNLFAVASKLSGLDTSSQDEAVQRLRPVRNAASGTD